MRRKRSGVWPHFQESGERKVCCRICNMQLTRQGNTSVMLRHLRRKHPGLMPGDAYNTESAAGSAAAGEEVWHSDAKVTQDDDVQPLYKQKKRKRSSVWAHFVEEGADKVSCQLCQEVVTNQKGSTSSMIRHLQYKHPNLHHDSDSPKLNHLHLRSSNTERRFMSVCDRLLEENQLTDCTLMAEGQLVQAHRLVLATCSESFESLFKTVTHANPVIVLRDVTIKELRELINYIYKGKILVKSRDLPGLLKTAALLKIHGLSEVELDESWLDNLHADQDVTSEVEDDDDHDDDDEDGDYSDHTNTAPGSTADLETIDNITAYLAASATPSVKPPHSPSSTTHKSQQKSSTLFSKQPTSRVPSFQGQKKVCGGSEQVDPLSHLASGTTDGTKTQNKVRIKKEHGVNGTQGESSFMTPAFTDAAFHQHNEHEAKCEILATKRKIFHKEPLVTHEISSTDGANKVTTSVTHEEDVTQVIVLTQRDAHDGTSPASASNTLKASTPILKLGRGSHSGTPTPRKIVRVSPAGLTFPARTTAAKSSPLVQKSSLPVQKSSSAQKSSTPAQKSSSGVQKSSSGVQKSSSGVQKSSSGVQKSSVTQKSSSGIQKSSALRHSPPPAPLSRKYPRHDLQKYAGYELKRAEIRLTPTDLPKRTPKPKPASPPSHSRKYSRRDLLAAAHLVRKGDLGITAAAHAFNIPRTTLFRASKRPDIPCPVKQEVEESPSKPVNKNSETKLKVVKEEVDESGSRDSAKNTEGKE